MASVISYTFEIRIKGWIDMTPVKQEEITKLRRLDNAETMRQPTSVSTTKVENNGGLHVTATTPAQSQFLAPLLDGGAVDLVDLIGKRIAFYQGLIPVPQPERIVTEASIELLTKTIRQNGLSIQII